MNVNYSMTRDKILERLTNEQLTSKWNAIDWKNVEKEVNKLQSRIAKAMKNKKYNDVKRLQYLLIHSFSAKVLAVRKVATNEENDLFEGNKELCLTPAVKMKVIFNLTEKHYNAKCEKRVLLKQNEKEIKKRLAIQTIYKRAMKILYILAIEPVTKVATDVTSLRFKKFKSAQDMCEYICVMLSKKCNQNWIFIGNLNEGLLGSCNSSLLKNVPIEKSILKDVLMAGNISKDRIFSTGNGTIYGITIVNIFMDMMFDEIQEKVNKYFNVYSKENTERRIKSRNKVNFVRYNNSFIVTANSKDVVVKVKDIVKEILKNKGLELSKEKNYITHTADGFDFLDWTFRKFNGKLIVKPSKKSIKDFVSKLSNLILGEGKTWEQEILIEKLNHQIKGWTDYHKPVVSSASFSQIDYVIFNLLYRWAKRRHPQKSYRWIISKYWKTIETSNWVFATEKNALLRVGRIVR